MAYIDTEELTFGDVVSGTLETVQRHAGKIGIYVGGFSAIGVAASIALPLIISSVDDWPEWTSLVGSLFGVGAGLSGIAIFAIAVIGQYLLWERMLSEEGFAVDPENRRYLAFFGQSILIALAIGIGYVLLIIPGLMLTARLVIAPAILISNERKLTDAMGSSSDAIRGNTTPIVFVIIVGAIGLGIISGISGFSAGTGALSGAAFYVSLVVEQVVSHFATGLMIALGVFLYGEKYGDRTGVTEVFT